MISASSLDGLIGTRFTMHAQTTKDLKKKYENSSFRADIRQQRRVSPEKGKVNVITSTTPFITAWGSDNSSTQKRNKLSR